MALGGTGANKGLIWPAKSLLLAIIDEMERSQLDFQITGRVCREEKNIQIFTYKGEYGIKKIFIDNKSVFPVNYFPFFPFRESLSKAALYFIKSNENADLLTPCQGITNIMFGYTTEESKKERQFCRNVIEYAILSYEKKISRMRKCIFILYVNSIF